MNWLLIVTSTFFAHSGQDAHIITFQTFNTQQRCEQVAKYVNNNYAAPKQKLNQTTAQCVRNE